MDCDTFNGYWKALGIIEAQNQLKALQASEYCNLSKKQKQKIWNKYKKLANPHELTGKRALTTTEIAKLTGMTNG